MWQDIVFLVGNFFGAAILIPTLADEDTHVPRTSSVPTMCMLGVYSATFFTMGMVLAAIGALSGTLVWAGIAAFRA